MRIVLDAMGSDTHPEPELSAAIQAAREFGDPVLLTGPAVLLRDRLRSLGASEADVQVFDAPETLEMTDKPADAARGKARSSMAVGIDLLKAGDADAFVTAGNTGGAMANALFRLGRIRGVKRPALTAVFPTRVGHVVVLDIGANADCRPEFLAQFAIFGMARKPARETAWSRKPILCSRRPGSISSEMSNRRSCSPAAQMSPLQTDSQATFCSRRLKR
jgi:glycerol-3-phosphate acyltransferase PlsX